MFLFLLFIILHYLFCRKYHVTELSPDGEEAELASGLTEEERKNFLEEFQNKLKISPKIKSTTSSYGHTQ
jgi:hypothetical protein